MNAAVSFSRESKASNLNPPHFLFSHNVANLLPLNFLRFRGFGRGSLCKMNGVVAICRFPTARQNPKAVGAILNNLGKFKFIGDVTTLANFGLSHYWQGVSYVLSTT
jgi:hypothetical protein